MVRGPSGEALFDIDGRLPGRGAYVCPLEACLASLRAPSLSHVLKGEVTLPPVARLRERLVASLTGKISGLLSIGRKAGKVTVGTDAVGESLDRHRAALVLIASDASERTAAAFRARSGAIPLAALADKARLGSWLGRESVAVASVTDPGIASRLAALIGRLTGIDANIYHEIAKGAEED